MDVATAKLLARYRAWGDKILYDSVAALPAGEAEKPHRTRFETIIGTLNHNLLIDLVWQAHIEGRDHGFKARDTVIHRDLSTLWAAQRAASQWWVDWCATQTDQSLEEPVRFRFIDGGDGVMTRGAILLHVVIHGSYHRGYIAEMFYEDSRKPPTTDLPVYFRDAAV
jgi:uncharacterized damage-inducible protein DinB